MEEIWKEIPGYEGYYRISSLGNLEGIDRVVWHKPSNRCKGFYYTIKARTIKYEYTKAGYKQAVLCKEGKTQLHRLHMLVAMAFLGYKKYSGLVVNHLNGIKTDNRVENLEITTILGNTQHAWRTGLIKGGFESFKSLLTQAQGEEIAELSRQGMSKAAIAKKFNVSRTTVHRAILTIDKSLLGTKEHPYKPSQHDGSSPTAIPIAQYDGDKLIGQYDCIKNAVKMTGVSRGMISACIHGRIAEGGGFIWKKLDKQKYNLK